MPALIGCLRSSQSHDPQLAISAPGNLLLDGMTDFGIGYKDIGYLQTSQVKGFGRRSAGYGYLLKFWFEIGENQMLVSRINKIFMDFIRNDRNTIF